MSVSGSGVSIFTPSTGATNYKGTNTFVSWECYMLVKYGNNGNFNVIDKNSQYLLELPLYPDQVTEGISAQWSTQKVLGRSSPVAAYANTDLKTVNFSLDLHRDLLTGSHSLTRSELENLSNNGEKADMSKQAAGFQMQTSKGPYDTRTWYTNANKMLQIACYPQYTKSGLIPPVTYFVFGQMILKGFVTNYQTEWKKPIINTFYGWNSVSITMECYPDSIISADDMITNKKMGTASTQNTYNTEFPSVATANSDVMVREETRERSSGRRNGTLGSTIMQTG